MRRLSWGLVGVASLVMVPSQAPAGQGGLAHASYYEELCTEFDHNSVRLGLEGPIYVRGQKFVGTVKTPTPARVAGCGASLPSTLEPFKLQGRGLGTFRAACTGEFHLAVEPAGLSTARLDCQATVVTPSGSAQGPVTIRLDLRYNPFPTDLPFRCSISNCEGELHTRRYNRIGTYFRP